MRTLTQSQLGEIRRAARNGCPGPLCEYPGLQAAMRAAGCKAADMSRAVNVKTLCRLLLFTLEVEGQNAEND